MKPLIILIGSMLLSLILLIIIVPFYLIGIIITKIESRIPLRYLFMLAILIVLSCEKEKLNCYDCIIKQQNGIEYQAKYCCSENDINEIIQTEALKGTVIKCKPH